MAADDIFTDDIVPRIRAGHRVLSIVTHEWERVEMMLIDAAEDLNQTLLKWTSASESIIEFNWETGGWQKSSKANKSFSDPQLTLPPGQGQGQGRFAVDVMLKWYKEEGPKNSILWLEDISPYIDPQHNPPPDMRRLLIRRFRDACQPPNADDGSQDGRTVVMSYPDTYLPMELEKDVEQFKLPLMGEEDLQTLLEDILDEINETRTNNPITIDQELWPFIVKGGLGLTLQEVDAAYRQIIARMNEEEPPRTKMNPNDVDVLNEQKAQIIEKTGVLEYVMHDEKMDDIGGMENLQEWLAFKKGAIYDKIDPPKGLLMMGVPGCGKSLMARAIAHEWKLPLLALKASNIFDKYVGESEGKIARALDIAEAISPCILWVDEIEKLLAGSGGGGENDGGVSTRVGGSILGWMADKKKPVFVVATANHPERMDAEYIRRGRFDERFFIDLPGKSVRKQIWEIHLKRRFPKYKAQGFDFNTLGIDQLVKESDEYTGAEIEACIVEAKDRARHLGMERPDAALLLSVTQNMTPDAVAQKDNIQNIRKQWAGRARRADKDEPVKLENEQYNEIREGVRDADEHFEGRKVRRSRGRRKERDE